jgi:hypothetical protein
MKLYLEEERKVVNHYLEEKERGPSSNQDEEMEENNRGTEELEETCVTDEQDKVAPESHVGVADKSVPTEKLFPQSIVPSVSSTTINTAMSLNPDDPPKFSLTSGASSTGEGSKKKKGN